jgi:hypothetical protein
MAPMFEDGDICLLVVDNFPQEIDVEGQFIDMNQADIGNA